MATGTLTISTDLMNSWLLKRLRPTSSPLARTSEAVASPAVSSKEKEIVENKLSIEKDKEGGKGGLYYIDYKNKRPEYLENFFEKLINWEFVESQLD